MCCSLRCITIIADFCYCRIFFSLFLGCLRMLLQRLRVTNLNTCSKRHPAILSAAVAAVAIFFSREEITAQLALLCATLMTAAFADDVTDLCSLSLFSLLHRKQRRQSFAAPYATHTDSSHTENIQHEQKHINKKLPPSVKMEAV